MDVWNHDKTRADGVSYKGNICVKRYRRSCGRGECPVDYEYWASREAHRAERRLRAYRPSQFRKVIHVIVSPSQEEIDALDYRKLRVKAYFVLKRVGIMGGVCIFHPFRQREEDGSWYLSPHFHVMGYGWVSQVGETYEETGWIVKNLGVRQSVYATLMYQLSHAGVYMKAEGEGKKATITWFGELSYNKFKAPKEELRELCPICGAPLVILTYTGVGDPPLNTLDVQENEGEYFIPFSIDWQRREWYEVSV